MPYVWLIYTWDMLDIHFRYSWDIPDTFLRYASDRDWLEIFFFNKFSFINSFSSKFCEDKHLLKILGGQYILEPRSCFGEKCLGAILLDTILLGANFCVYKYYSNQNVLSQIFVDQIKFSSSTPLISHSSWLTVSAWVSSSSTPPCLNCAWQ